MKYKMKKLAVLMIAFSLVLAAFAPATSAKAQIAEAVKYVADSGEADAISAEDSVGNEEDTVITGDSSDTVVTLDASYPEADEEGDVYSAVIPAEAFMQFDGAVALDLEFEKTGTGEWPGFLAMTTEMTTLTVKGNTSPWAATESLTVMLEEEQVELAIAEGGLRFMLLDMFFTRATLREATPDDAYVGDWNKGYEMPASELAQYAGDVALVVDYRMLEENPYTWCNFSVNEVAGWRKLSAEEYAFTEYKVDRENLINVPDTDSTAVVVLPEETVAMLVEKDGLVLQVYGIIIEDVTVLSATPEDTFTLCTSYPEPDVDGNVVSAAIPAEALLSHGGNVAFTVDYVTTGTVEYPYAIPRTLGWTELAPKGNVSYEGESGTITFVFDASDISAAIAEGGILFQLNGVYITKAKLAPATAKDYYAGDWNEGYRIPTAELEEFTGDLALYIDYQTVDNELYEYPAFSVNKIEGWEKFTEEDYVYSEYPLDTEYSLISVPTDKSRVRVVLTAEAVAEAMAGGGIMLQVNGLIIDNVILADGIESSNEIELDSSYPEADEDGSRVSETIPATALLPFEGPVAIDLNFEKTGTEEWPGFSTMTTAWTGLYPEGDMSPWNATDSLTIVLDEEQVKLAIAEGGILFNTWGLFFTKATLREATPDDYYAGDWNEGYRVPTAEFADMTGDVTFVVEYKPLKDTSYEEYWVALFSVDNGLWELLPAEEYFYSEYSVNDAGQMFIPKEASQVIVTLPAETMAKLAKGDGLLLQVMGVIIENVTLIEDAVLESVYEMDSAYPEANENGEVFSKVIPSEGFLLQNGPVAITLDFVATGEHEWPGMNVFTAEGSLLYVEGNTYPWNAETGTITIVLDEEDVDKVIAEGGVVFGLDGVYFTQAEVRQATPYDYYVGDWNTGATISKSELEAANGDVTVTVEYLMIPEYDWYGINLFDRSNWTALTKADYVTDSCLNDFNWVVVDNSRTSFSVTVKEEAVRRVIANGEGMGISVYGLIVEDVLIGDGGVGEEPEGDLVFLPTELDTSGYGYSAEALEDGALAVAFEDQYQEIRFHFPEKIDLSVYDRMVVTLGTASSEQVDAVALKVVPTDAVLDQYDNPTPILEVFGVAVYSHGDILIDLSKFPEKKVDYLAIMAQEGACDVNVYGIAFLPKESTSPDTPAVPDIELSTLPEGSFAVTPAASYFDGYGFTKEELENGALAVSFTNQYQEIRFRFPDGVDLSKYDKLVVTMASASPEQTDAVALKVIATDAELDEWSNLTPFYTEWGVVKYPGGDVIIDLSEFGDKTVERLSVMSNEGAFDADVYIYRIAFLPKEGTTPDTPDEPVIPYTPIEAFVTRMYRIILEREPDAGSATWINGLKDGSMTGVRVADGFVLSEEMLNKSVSNEEFVKILYRAFFGREADEGGLATWKGLLDAGCKKQYVFAGFANSTEFGNLCAEAGIVQGRAMEYLADRQTGLSEKDYKVWCFVERMYTEVLGRTADEAGVRTWVGVLQDGSYTGVKVADGFLMSEEFLAKNMTNEEYVKILYRAFFGRDADAEGLATWTGALANGWTTKRVFAGFANSNEFAVLCEQAGITRGTALEN